jgi:hypothetical protein
VSAVSGADLFGITWRTIKSDEVVIELTKRDNGASKIVEIAPSDYDKRRVTAGDYSPAVPTDPDMPNSGIRLLGPDVRYVA